MLVGSFNEKKERGKEGRKREKEGRKRRKRRRGDYFPSSLKPLSGQQSYNETTNTFMTVKAVVQLQLQLQLQFTQSV